jgi:hypothetical protein
MNDDKLIEEITIKEAIQIVRDSEWISVEDGPPEEGQHVFVSRDFNNAPVRPAVYKNGKYSTGMSSIDFYAYPTHWTPLSLPSPPSTKADR